MPKAKPEIVTVPKMNYIAVRGSGDPKMGIIRRQLVSYMELHLQSK